MAITTARRRRLLERARRQFEVNARRKKPSGTFDEVLTFLQEGISLTSLAEKLGVTRQAVSIMYNKYFALALGESGRRRRMRLHPRADKSDKQRACYRARTLVKLVWGEATEHGFSVQLPRPLPQSSTTELVIGGRQCLCLNSRSMRVYSTSRTRTVSYHRFWIARDSITKPRYLVLVAHRPEGPSYFVIPSEDLRAVYGPKRRGYIGLYVPVEARSPQSLNPPKFESLDYLGAWHLLRHTKKGGTRGTQKHAVVAGGQAA